jgi:ABC-2 type transport system permease protein
MDGEAVRMQALRVTYAIWLREVKLFARERGRIIGMIGQPLMYLLIVGQGIASGMTLNRSPGGMGYMLFLYPGILGMSVLFTSIFSAMSIIWDREFGFLKEVLVAPAPRWAVAAGKVLGGATVATLQSAILLLLAPLAGVWPTPLVVVELLLLCFLMSCAMTSLGVAIAARMRSMQGFQMVMNFLVMPLYFLSGAMFPVTSAPPWMKTLMTVDPLTYGVDALRTVVLSAAPGEAGALQEAARRVGLVRFDLLTDVSVLVGVAVVLAAVAAFSFNRTD